MRLIKKDENWFVNQIRFILNIGQFEIDKLDFHFNREFQNWLFRNSYEKEYPKDTNGVEHDEKGFITNATFNGKTKDGLDLTEKDFLEELIPKIEKIDLSLLKLDEKKRLEFYKEYLMKKKDGLMKDGPDPEMNLSHFFYDISDLDSFIEEVSSAMIELKGKDIKAMIQVFEKECILYIPNRKFKKFYDCLKEAFKHDIGTYTGINDARPDEIAIKPIRMKLLPIIAKYKT